MAGATGDGGSRHVSSARVRYVFAHFDLSVYCSMLVFAMFFLRLSAGSLDVLCIAFLLIGLACLLVSVFVCGGHGVTVAGDLVGCSCLWLVGVLVAVTLVSPVLGAAHVNRTENWGLT